MIKQNHARSEVPTMDKNVALLLTLVLGLIAVLGGVLGSYYVYNEGVTGASTLQDDTLNAALLAQTQMEQRVQELQKQLTDKDADFKQKVALIQEEALKQIDELEAAQQKTEEKPKEVSCEDKVKNLERLSDGASDDVDRAQDDVDDYNDRALKDQQEISRLSGLIANTTDSTQLTFLRDSLRNMQRDLRNDEDDLDTAEDDLKDAQRSEDSIKRELRRTRSDCRQA